MGRLGHGTDWYRAEDLPEGLKPGRVDGATERDREPQKKYRGLGSQRL